MPDGLNVEIVVSHQLLVIRRIDNGEWQDAEVDQVLPVRIETI
tara:strand:- start:407 stop:535 length:129 start_codon:yes stop_codon:yes gene_type:complete